MTVDVAGGDYLFRASDQLPTFRGFLQVFDDMQEEGPGEQEDSDPTSKIPPTIASGQKTSILNILPRQHFTKPPGRYTESSLVKDLEALGIGRPSTYALIVSTVIDRKYVEHQERKLYATDLGIQVNDLLVKYFPRNL